MNTKVMTMNEIRRTSI